jgi:hypothetical protein
LTSLQQLDKTAALLQAFSLCSGTTLIEIAVYDLNDIFTNRFNILWNSLP